jgi:serine/threonine protein kinase
MAGTEGQLAPEINKHLGAPFIPGGYHGEAVDVFNAGIVLFNLLFGTGPFYNAAADDFYYGHLARNQGRKFWTK